VRRVTTRKQYLTRRMAVLAHSEIRAMIHACVQAKNLNIAQEVWDAPVLPDNDSRCVTDDRAWEEFYSRFDGLAETPYLLPVQWPILGPAALSPCETSMKRTTDSQ